MRYMTISYFQGSRENILGGFEKGLSKKKTVTIIYEDTPCIHFTSYLRRSKLLSLYRNIFKIFAKFVVKHL